MAIAKMRSLLSPYCHRHQSHVLWECNEWAAGRVEPAPHSANLTPGEHKPQPLTTTFSPCPPLGKVTTWTNTVAQYDNDNNAIMPPKNRMFYPSCLHKWSRRYSRKVLVFGQHHKLLKYNLFSWEVAPSYFVESSCLFFVHWFWFSILYFRSS